jgi:hypothetical protein
MTKFKLKSFKEFLENRPGLNIGYKVMTHDEFIENMKPIMCSVCQRIFNPTPEEIERNKTFIKEMDEFILEWEVIPNHKC